MFDSIQKKLVFSFVFITLISVLLSSWYSYHKSRKHFLDEIKKQNHDNLMMIAGEIKSHFGWIEKDILFLRDLLCSSLYCDPAGYGEPVGLYPEQLKHSFIAIASNHLIYHQVRYLNENGREVIRVDYEDGSTHIIPDHLLQNKQYRYYFKEAIRLEKGEIYISPMDLNIEHGSIEEPIIPTIRFATPVFDHKNDVKGIIVLNVRADFVIYTILEKNRFDSPGTKKNYYLVNDKGYFLYHPNKQYQFGFMRPDRTILTDLFPDLGRIIGSMGNGSGTAGSRPSMGFMETDDALYAWHHVFFSKQDIQKMTYGIHGQYQKGMHYTDSAPEKMQWILISSTDTNEIFTIFSKNLTELFLISFVILFICVTAAVLTGLTLAKPLVRLSDAVKKIGGGDLSARAVIKTRDEIGNLAGTINKMAEDLESTLNQCRLSEERYRLLFENSKDSLFVTDKDGTLVEINQSFKTLMGYDDFLPSQIVLLSDHFKDRESYHAFLRSIQASGFVKNLHCDLVTLNSKPMNCLITSSVIPDNNQGIKGFEGVVRDITKRVSDIKKKKQFRTLLNEETILAEDQERRVLGQVLHDDIAQDLALSKLKIQEAESFASKKEQRLLLTHSNDLLSLIISKIRNIIFDLYPVTLESKGLVASIEWYNTHFSQKIGVPILFNTSIQTLELKKSHQIYLFRAYKELLNNCFKHANASEIVVTLRKMGNAAVLVVNDDGEGFDSTDVFEISKEIQGIGLFSIREWADSVGGQFTIESDKGQGTRAILEIQIPGERLA